MNTVYLVSEQQVRTQSLIGQNVDSAYILAAIGYAQDINLQEVIGTKMLRSIKTQVELHTYKSDEYKTLIENYIQPYLLQQVMADIIIPLTAKIRNAGVVMNADTHYATLSITDATKVRDEYMHKASFLAARIIDYIKANIQVFAEDVVGLDQFVALSRNTTKSPIFFPKNYLVDEDDLYCTD